MHKAASILTYGKKRKIYETGSIFLYDRRTEQPWKREYSAAAHFSYASDLQFPGMLPDMRKGVQYDLFGRGAVAEPVGREPAKRRVITVEQLPEGGGFPPPRLMCFHKTMSCSFSGLIVSLKEIQTNKDRHFRG